MYIKDIIKNRKLTISLEFFPPKTEKGWNNLYKTIEKLSPMNPGYVSVTYGAGGSTRENTHKLISEIIDKTDLETVAHLTCVGSSKNEIKEVLKKYKEIGVHNILALRGDVPHGQTLEEATKDFTHASDLISFIKNIYPEFGIGVAGFPEGHPESPNRLVEIENLKKKVDSGADYIVTQLFFNNMDFFDYQSRCSLAGIDIPIIPGLMPITNKKGMIRMAELSGGTKFPPELLKYLYNNSSDEDLEKAGIEWTSKQISELLDKGVNNIHLYTLNSSVSVLKILDNLGFKSLSF